MLKALEKRILGWLRRRTIARLAAAGASSEPFDGIWIHEDDEGLCSMYPAETEGEVMADLTASIEASERNRSPGGMGWDAMYAIQPPTKTYADLRLALEHADAALSQVLPRVRGYRATIGSVMHQAKRDPLGRYEDDAYCYGFGSECFLKLEAGEGGLVQAVWYIAHTGESEQLGELRKGMEAIDSLIPSLIVDYNADSMGRVGDKAFLDSYFAGLIEQVSPS